MTIVLPGELEEAFIIRMPTQNKSVEKRISESAIMSFVIFLDRNVLWAAYYAKIQPAVER